MKLVSMTISSDTPHYCAILPDALRSVLPWVDECHLTLLDTIPPTERPAILRPALDVAHHKFMLKRIPLAKGHIQDWRNAALDFAAERKADWAVLLDTDWRILPNGVDIRAFLESQPATRQIINVMSDDGSQTRALFFRIPSAHRFTYAVHETLNGAEHCEAERIRFHELPKTEEQAVKRIKMNDIPGLRKQMDAEPSNPRHRFFYASTQATLGNWDEASIYFRQLTLIPNVPNGLAAFSLYKAADCELMLEYPDKALRLLTTGLQYFPAMAELHYLAGVICMHLGRPLDALVWELQAVMHGYQSAHHIVRTGMRDFHALYEGPWGQLVEIYTALKDQVAAQNAVDNYFKAQRARKDFCEKGIS